MQSRFEHVYVKLQSMVLDLEDDLHVGETSPCWGEEGGLCLMDVCVYDIMDISELLSFFTG